jgi:peptidoglycan/xylan/chitin deacetylase (PgdA/CDA1 family)
MSSGIKKKIKVANLPVLFIFMLVIILVLVGCSIFEKLAGEGLTEDGSGEKPSFSTSYIEFIDDDEAAYPGENIKVKITVINSGEKDAKNVKVGLITSELFKSDNSQASWSIDVLKCGDENIFNTVLTLADGISEDTLADIKLEISSDEVDSYTSPGYSLMVYGTGQFKGDFIPIIGMHAIEDHIEDPIELYTGHFDKLCSVLKEYGYETITLGDLLDYIDYGKALPEKSIIITSDDGFQDVYTNGFPVLKKYGYKMTVFLVTGALGETEAERKTNEYFERGSGPGGSPIRPLLIWPEIEEMYEYGCEFQSHTVNHVRLGIASDEVVLYELEQSKEDIEYHLGNEVLFVALPKGNYNPDKIPLFEEAGYRGALRHAGGAEDINTIDLYSIKRVEFNSLISPDQYASHLELDRSIEIDYEASGLTKEPGEEFAIEFDIKNTGEEIARITSLELELPDNIELAGVSEEGSISQYPGISEGVYMWVSDSYVIESGSGINLIVMLKGGSTGRSVIKFRATYRGNYINCDDIEIEIK